MNSPADHHNPEERDSAPLNHDTTEEELTDADLAAVDAAMARFLTPDFTPRDGEGDTAVDDLVQPSAQFAPRLDTRRRRELLDVVSEELELRRRNSGKVEQVIYQHRIADGEHPADLASRASTVLRTLDVPEGLEGTLLAETTAAIHLFRDRLPADVIETIEKEGGTEMPPAKVRTLSAVLAAIQGVPRQAARDAYLRSLQAPQVEVAAERLTISNASPEDRAQVDVFTAIFDQVRKQTEGEPKE